MIKYLPSMCLGGAGGSLIVNGQIVAGVLIVIAGCFLPAIVRER